MRRVSKAFTLIELVFVIVIIGFLAIASMMLLPNYTLLNDTNFVAMEIKRVQAKAIGNNRFGFGNGFDNNKCIDISKNAINVTKDATGGYSMHASTTLAITGLTTTVLCFDYIGRVYDGDFNTIVNAPVTIRLTYSGDNKTITVVPFSGYVMY